MSASARPFYLLGRKQLDGIGARVQQALPLEAMLEALGADGVPAYLSSSAGTYLCNQTFYTTRHLLASQGREIPAGFIHLPLSPSMVVAAGLDQPSMDVPLMIRAIELVLRVVARSTPSR